MSLQLIVLPSFVIAVCLVTCAVLFARARAGREVPPYEPRRPAPWNGLELLLLVIVFVALQLVVFGAVIAFVRARGDSSDEINDLTTMASPLGVIVAALVNVLWFGLGIVLVKLVSRATWVDQGLTLRHIVGDIGRGVVAFLAVAAPVYAIQFVLTQFFESAHPLVQLFERESNGWNILLLFVAAVVVAPIVEEFMFRAMLQGWLENIAARYQSQSTGFGSESRVLSSDSETHHQPTPATDSSQEPGEPMVGLPAHPTAATEPNPYASPATNAYTPLNPVDPDGMAPRLRGIYAAAPILVSSTLFAGAHYTNGPDPVALFLLALVLGYLYQRTHRLWPSVVLHACLNATSLLLLISGLE